MYQIMPTATVKGLKQILVNWPIFLELFQSGKSAKMNFWEILELFCRPINGVKAKKR